MHPERGVVSEGQERGIKLTQRKIYLELNIFSLPIMNITQYLLQFFCSMEHKMQPH